MVWEGNGFLYFLCFGILVNGLAGFVVNGSQLNGFPMYGLMNVMVYGFKATCRGEAAAER